MRRLARALRGERGAGLAELVVALALLGIVITGVLAVVTAVYRGHNVTRRDSDTLASLRTAMDRFTKEIRQARVIYPESDAREVRFWVDYDRDYQQDLADRIIWRIEEVSGQTVLTRTTEETSAPVTVVARHLVAADAFVYNTVDPGDATLITVNLSASAPGVDAEQRSVHTNVRLRNATA